MDSKVIKPYVSDSEIFSFFFSVYSLSPSQSYDGKSGPTDPRRFEETRRLKERGGGEGGEEEEETTRFKDV